MGFSNPLGLLALLAIPLVLYLHLFRRRFEPRRVSALFLFAADALPAAAGRTRTRLLKTVSLWSELVAALALALWLAGLHFGAPEAEPHLVLVLDDSASMQARGPLGDTLARARTWAEATLAELPRGAEVTVIRTGPRPEVLAGPRAPVHEARSALDAWDPRQPTHDAVRAWELGLDLAGPGATLVYLSDRADFVPPPRYRLLAFGESIANAALVSGRRVRREEEERVFVDVRGWGSASIPTKITLEVQPPDAEARVVAEQELELPSDRTVHVAWTLPHSEFPLRVRLGDDALMLDNELLLLPEPRRIVPIFVGFDPEMTRALQLQRAFASLSDVLLLRAPEQARLLLSAEEGAGLAGTTEFLISAPGETRDAWIGPFLLERRRVPGAGAGPPLLSGLSLEGIVWSAGAADLPGIPLVLAGERALLTEESVRGCLRLRMNLDPTRSNLCASPDWPILLSNLVENVRHQVPGPLQVNVRVGSEIGYRFAGTPEEAAAHVLFDPRGAGHPARGWRLLTFEAQRTGIHELKRDGRVVARYAANFVDPAESDCRVRGEAEVAAAAAVPIEAAAAVGAAGSLEARLLALLLLLALTVDWYVLGRKP